MAKTEPLASTRRNEIANKYGYIFSRHLTTTDVVTLNEEQLDQLYKEWCCMDAPETAVENKIATPLEAYKENKKLDTPPIPTETGIKGTPILPSAGSDFDLDDRVNHPSYYNQGPIIRLPDGQLIRVECIDIIRDMPTWKGNAIKYLWRCGLKKEQGLDDIQKEIEDIEKAIFYLKDKVEQLRQERKTK